MDFFFFLKSKDKVGTWKIIETMSFYAYILVIDWWYASAIWVSFRLSAIEVAQKRSVRGPLGKFFSLDELTPQVLKGQPFLTRASPNDFQFLNFEKIIPFAWGFRFVCAKSPMSQPHLCVLFLTSLRKPLGYVCYIIIIIIIIIVITL